MPACSPIGFLRRPWQHCGAGQSFAGASWLLGAIADYFARAVRAHTDQRIVAVASRSAERAEAFASRYSIDRSYGSYEQLMNDPEVQIVYVAAPHSEHLPLGLQAISAGNTC